MDALDSNNEKDQTCIPIPSGLPSSSIGLDFRSYECFFDMGSGAPIEDNYDGNTNIRRWSYDDEPDLRVWIH